MTSLSGSVYLRPDVRGTQATDVNLCLPTDLDSSISISGDGFRDSLDQSASVLNPSTIPTQLTESQLEDTHLSDGFDSDVTGDEAEDTTERDASSMDEHVRTFLEDCMRTPFPPNPDYSVAGNICKNSPGQGVSVHMHSFNINGWKTNHSNLLAALNPNEPHIIAIQETLLDSTSGRAAEGLLTKLGFRSVWGHMLDPIYNSKSVLRCNRVACPGVAFVFSKRLDVSPLPLHTPGAQAMFQQGRLVAIRVNTPQTAVLVYNVYMPSGADAQAERETCYKALFEELTCQPDQPAMVLGDINEDVDRNALSCQLTMQGWRRPHYVDTEGRDADYTYKCGPIESTIDGFYFSALAFPSVYTVIVRKLHGKKGTLQHTLLSAEVQLCDTEPLTRPPQSISFCRGSPYHQHSPIDWKRQERILHTQMANILQDYRSHEYTSWRLDLDQLWTRYQQLLYQHLVACHEVDPEQHGDDFRFPTSDAFVSPRPDIRSHKPPGKTKHTGPMRIRAHLYRLIETHRNPHNDAARRKIKDDADFICHALQLDQETFQFHLNHPEKGIPVWKECIERYMCRYRDSGVRKWQRSLVDRFGRITRKCYHWLKRELLPNHFALYDGITLRTGAREFFQHCREY
eukprot:6492639-Amphidinium_carterae.3